MRLLPIACIAFTLLNISCNQKTSPEMDSESDAFTQRMNEKLYPFEEYFLQKNYPETTFAYEKYRAGIEAAKKVKVGENTRFNTWTNQGPGNIGGRINTIAINPDNSAEMMLGYSLGGIFKTTDDGVTWNPIFDDEANLSLSDITYDPNNTSTIYAGTGDHNISGYPVNGYGVHKTTDGGVSWENKGLIEAGVISEIGISKANSEVVYAATMGIPFIRSEERGLYKSDNGGDTWEHVFYLNDSTGVIDLEVHPTDENIVWATTWTRVRNNQESVIQSDQAGIFKTIDGGATWEKLENGLPTGNLVRPGLALYGGNPDILYAMYVHDNQDTLCSAGYHLEGVYKTVDGGDSWTEVNTAEEAGLPCTCLGGFGWYFGQIRVNPNDEDDISILGVDMWRTRDGGSSWDRSVPGWWTYEVHADKHDLVFVDTFMIVATDGGAYRGGIESENWEDIENNVTTQFYRAAVSPHISDEYFGGAQDNGSTGGNETNINEWPRIAGGDGFQMVFNPENPNSFFVETQNGNIRKTTNGGANFRGFTSGLEGRRHWDMQYIMSHHDTTVMYTGTERMFRTTGHDDPIWEPVSPKLSDTLDMSIGNRHTMSTISESPLNPDILYFGTTDARVWRSLDYGVTWDRIDGDLPTRYISDIVASPFDENVVYVAMSGYKDNDNSPYIYRSDDYGDTWVSIQGDLPQVGINSILLVPEWDNVLLIGTDAGVFDTWPGTGLWKRTGINMPIVPVYDLVVSDQGQVAAATFARGIYTYDVTDLVINTIESEIVDWQVLPNVTQDVFTISYQESENGILYLYDVNGQLIRKESVSHDARIDIQNLSTGVYFVNVKAGDKIYKTKKVIKID